MALSEAEKEIVKQKVKNRRREMLGASLDESLSFISDDELVEITPSNIRIRKKILKSSIRQKETRDKLKAK